MRLVLGEAGNLLATDTTRGLARFEKETLTIALNSPNIARITAGTLDFDTGFTLDRLTFSGGAQIVDVGADQTVSNVDFGSQEIPI